MKGVMPAPRVTEALQIELVLYLYQHLKCAKIYDILQ